MSFSRVTKAFTSEKLANMLSALRLRREGLTYRQIGDVVHVTMKNKDAPLEQPRRRSTESVRRLLLEAVRHERRMIEAANLFSEHLSDEEYDDLQPYFIDSNKPAHRKVIHAIQHVEDLEELEYSPTTSHESRIRSAWSVALDAQEEAGWWSNPINVGSP